MDIHDPTGRAPRLTMRLAIAIALTLIVAVGGAFLFVRQRATSSAERDAEGSARLVTAGILRRVVTPADLQSPVDAARANQLDATVFVPLHETRGVVRVSMFAPNGRIVYSSTRSLIGTAPGDLDRVDAALAGRVTKGVSRLNHDQPGEDSRRVLEVYAPISFSSGTPAGVFEIYEDYAVVSADVRRTIYPVGIFLAVIALGLFGSLFPILRRVTRTLEQRNERLRQQADELRRGLVERQEAAEALHARETQMRLMLRQLPALVVTCDRSLAITSANGQGLATLVPPEHLLLGQPLAMLMDAGDGASLVAAHRSALADTSTECEFAWRDREFSAYIEPLRDGADEIVGTICLALDLTDQRAAEAEHALLEAELQQVQKLEAVGQLAAGIAHDFNNILTAVRGYAELLHDNLAADDPNRELSREVVVASDQASALTGRLLSFSRRAVLTPRVADLNDLVRNVRPLLAPTLGAVVDLEVGLHRGPLWIEGDVGQIEQAIVNLALNARDAMPQGGSLRIATARAADDRPAELPHSRFVCVSVSDTGTGVPDDIRGRIFEPFFTTKAAGEGTGLGLASVWRTVTATGGLVLLDSEGGVGSTFTIYLPEASHLPSDLPEAQADAAKSGDGETVLVVDDEEQIRMFVQRALESHGYRVIVAEDGSRGLAVVDEHADPIDLLITDVRLPGLSGPELAGMLRDRRPDLPVLFVSGHAGEEFDGLNDGFLTWFLQKPFGVDALLQKAHQALTRSRPREPSA